MKAAFQHPRPGRGRNFRKHRLNHSGGQAPCTPPRSPHLLGPSGLEGLIRWSPSFRSPWRTAHAALVGLGGARSGARARLRQHGNPARFVCGHDNPARFPHQDRGGEICPPTPSLTRKAGGALCALKSRVCRYKCTVFPESAISTQKSALTASAISKVDSASRGSASEPSSWGLGLQDGGKGSCLASIRAGHFRPEGVTAPWPHQQRGPHADPGPAGWQVVRQRMKRAIRWGSGAAQSWQEGPVPTVLQGPWLQTRPRMVGWVLSTLPRLGGLGHCQLVGGVVHSVGSLCGPPSLLHAVL